MNLGMGMPEGIAAVAEEKGVSDFTLTVEAGGIGGSPLSGVEFGAALKYRKQSFSSISCLNLDHGGGLDQAFLGLAEADPQVTSTSSNFGPRIAGCGGIYLHHAVDPELYFIGTFTAKGLEVEIADGKLQYYQRRKNQEVQAQHRATYILHRARKRAAPEGGVYYRTVRTSPYGRRP